MSCVFGPVPSRRLGRSLGVDLVPFKTCTYDCVYCQLGRTTDKTAQRREWVRPEAVLDDIRRKLDRQPDYITLSGSGEPTLHARLGELIEGIKTITAVPVAVLTNGSLLWRPDVRQELAQADLIVPSLDAGDDVSFRHINRPHESIFFSQMVEGLIALRREFRGQYWLEVFLLAGGTSTDAHVGRIAAMTREIQPDRVQLNTATRPPAEPFVKAVPRARLAELADSFQPRAEVIADHARESPGQPIAGCGDILEMIRRRPCTVQDIAAVLGLHVNEVLKCLGRMTHEKLVEQAAGPGGVYYKAVRSAGDVPG